MQFDGVPLWQVGVGEDFVDHDGREVGFGIIRAGRAAGLGAGPPLGAVIGGGRHSGLFWHQGEALSIGRDWPGRLVVVVEGEKRAAGREGEGQGFAAVVQLPRVRGGDRHTRIFGVERGGITRQHKEASRWQKRVVRKGEGEARAESEAGEIERVWADVFELEKFEIIARDGVQCRRIVHDLSNDQFRQVLRWGEGGIGLSAPGIAVLDPGADAGGLAEGYGGFIGLCRGGKRSAGLSRVVAICGEINRSCRVGVTEREM